MTTQTSPLGSYLSSFHSVLDSTEATDGAAREIAPAKAVEDLLAMARRVHGRGDKVMFIGNGGSAAIASHMSEDFAKAAGIRSLAFSDAPTLTCLGNDYGFEHIFEKQIEWLARDGDMLIAISSSGRSMNILRGVEAARRAGCHVATLSGFDADNPLRSLGDLNLYLPSNRYGFVEAGHLVLLSAVVDLAMGWGQ